MDQSQVLVGCIFSGKDNRGRVIGYYRVLSTKRAYRVINQPGIKVWSKDGVNFTQEVEEPVLQRGWYGNPDYYGNMTVEKPVEGILLENIYPNTSEEVREFTFKRIADGLGGALKRPAKPITKSCMYYDLCNYEVLNEDILARDVRLAEENLAKLREGAKNLQVFLDRVAAGDFEDAPKKKKEPKPKAPRKKYPRKKKTVENLPLEGECLREI